jgi:hypothetical protein
MMVVLPTNVDEYDWKVLQCAFDLSETHGLENFIALCRADLAQLWVHGNLMAITTVHQTKTGRAIKIEAMAGEFANELMLEMEAFGKSVGCNKIFFTGRRGWVKRLADYHLTSVTLTKEL